jgi:hypothetical protein
VRDCDRGTGAQPARAWTWSTGGRYEFFYDPRLLEASDLRERIRAEVGDTADPVDFVPSVNSTRDLAEAFRRLHRRDWHPMVTSTAYSGGLNFREAVIEVHVDASAPPDLIVALQALAPDLVRVTPGRVVSTRPRQLA